LQQRRTRVCEIAAVNKNVTIWHLASHLAMPPMRVTDKHPPHVAVRTRRLSFVDVDVFGLDKNMTLRTVG
jgi:hypothetical protein